MAQDIAVDDYLHVTYASRQISQNGLNVIWFKVFEKGVGVISDADMAIAIEAAATPLYKALLNENAFFYGVRVQLHKANGNVYIPQTVVSTAGGGVVEGEPLPYQSALLVSLKTARAGRRYRGRKYLPFLSTSDMDSSGLWTGATKIVAGALAAQCFGRQTFTIGGSIVKIDPFIASVPIVDPETVTSLVLRDAPAQMRTRSQLRHGDALPW